MISIIDIAGVREVEIISSPEPHAVRLFLMTNLQSDGSLTHSYKITYVDYTYKYCKEKIQDLETAIARYNDIILELQKMFDEMYVKKV